MSIPKYILKAADRYVSLHVKNDSSLFDDGSVSLQTLVRDAFIAGYEATRKNGKSSDVVLDVNQEKMFEESWKAYGCKGNKMLAKRKWSEISASIQPIILAHIKAYVSSREKRFTKDFERYLKDEEYQKIVFTGNNVVFDPRQFDNTNEYHPTTDGFFQYWDDKRQCLMFNGYIDQLNDGYTADTRPDGARVAWQMYEWVWSSRTKEWIKQND